MDIITKQDTLSIKKRERERYDSFIFILVFEKGF